MGVTFHIRPLRDGAAVVKTPQTIMKEEISIGRLDSNDLVLPDAQVSGRHAKLSNQSELLRSTARRICICVVQKRGHEFEQDLHSPIVVANGGYNLSLR